MKKRTIRILLLLLMITMIGGFSLIKTSSVSIMKKEWKSSKLEDYNMFLPDISERKAPQDLLVMVFVYNDYPNHTDKIDYIYNMTDQEIETKYANEIFGTGTIEDQTWSINDLYKENSKGTFYFNPILLGNNTSGVYVVRFDKDYDSSLFSTDMRTGFQSIVEKGLNTEGFSRNGSIKNQTKHVLCVFPTIRIAHVGTYRLTETMTTNVAVVDYGSPASTKAHELGHSLLMPDLYPQGTIATLMGDATLKSTTPDIRYPYETKNHTLMAHVDPIHKVALGWTDYDIIEESQTVTLYPTTSSNYKPIILRTEDNNQYFVIENRIPESFESQINLYAMSADSDDPEETGSMRYEGINVWRVDKAGYDDYSNENRRKWDYVIGVLQNQLDSMTPNVYTNSSDSSDKSKTPMNYEITYVKKNEDNSIDVDISFYDLSEIIYKVRYNSNNGNNARYEKNYRYSQKILFPADLFETEGKRFIGWNTKSDGSGTSYDENSIASGLKSTSNSVLNLYAQWETITYPITNISLNKTSLELMKEKSEMLKATIEPENTTDSKTITWTSNNPKVAKVTSSGKVTGVSKGNATITATTSNGLTATCEVTVKGKTGWYTENGNKYYYDNDVMQKGIIEVDGNRYLLGITSGKLYTGGLATITDGDQKGTYYVNNEGIVQTGQQQIGSEKYYFDELGRMQKGIIEVNGNRYLYGITSGKLYTGGLATITDGDQKGTYYVNSEGIVQTGQHQIGNEKYYFDELGRMQKGIIEVNGNRYLYGITSGKLYTGGLATITDGDQKGTYITDNNGIVQVGWIEFNGQKYYSDESGKLLNGVQKIGDKSYLFGVYSFKLFYGLASTPDGKTYYSNNEGILQKGTFTINGKKYTFGENYYAV